MKHMLRSTVTDIQFWIAVVVGWLVCGHFLSFKQEIGTEYSEGEELCAPCVDSACPKCPAEAAGKIESGNENGFYRDFPWKPRSAEEDEMNYWTMVSKKKRDGMVNEDPRVGINGMWRLERDQVDSYLRQVTKETDGDDDVISAMTFNRMMRKFDPFYGVSYIANMDVTRKAPKDGAKESQGPTTEMFELRRKFKTGKPTLIDIKRLGGNETVHIITPLSKVTDRFHRFMERLEQNVYHQQTTKPEIRLIFVIFGAKSSADSRATITALQKFQFRNPTANLVHVFVDGDFSRAIGLHTGAEQCPDDALMLFLDVDLSITPEFLARIRANTIRHQRVVFPVMFSQFDPDVIDTYMKTTWVKTTSDGRIGGDEGFWIYYAFGVAAMYKSDYLEVGGFKLDITGWGGEDVDLFKRLVSDSDLDVMTTVDPDLIHIYHSRACDINLSPDQYRMCIGALAETIGSRIQLGTLYLKNRDEHR